MWSTLQGRVASHPYAEKSHKGFVVGFLAEDSVPEFLRFSA